MILKDWTAYELAKRAKMSTQTSARLSKGDTNFSINTLDRLCKVFGVDRVGDIIEFENE